MIKVRLAQQSDFETLTNVYIVAYNSLNIGEHWDRTTALALIQYLYEDQPDLFFVAEDDNKIVGAITASVKPWWDGNHLIDGELFVHPDYQKRGLGTQLIKTLFTTAVEKYQAVAWDTFTHTVYEHPLKWYKSIGFQETEQWTMISGDIKEVLSKLEEK